MMKAANDAATPHLWTYENIPTDLQALTQWVCWRYEQRDNGKWAKVPINAATGFPASVTNPAHWHNFALTVAAYNKHKAIGVCDGIGFVFCHAVSDYVGIDIDDAKGDETLLRHHQLVFEKFSPHGYCERSPSRLGVHIIVRGTIKGVRRHGVEAYSTGRFFTFTGEVVCSNPIAVCQELLEHLERALAPDRQTQAVPSLHPQIEDDATIIRRMFAAKNGANAETLFNGRSTNGDASANDLALCNCIAFYTQNVGQIERIWLQSALGKREKVQRRAAYRSSTIRRALDRHATAQAVSKGIDYSALMVRARATVGQVRQIEGQAS